MGIMKKAMPDINETLDELKEKLSKEKNAAIKRRIHMLVLVKSGEAKTRKELAKHLAIHRNTIGIWLSIYQSKGLVGLTTIATPFRQTGQRSLPEDIMSALKQRLEEPSGFGSYVEIQKWLETSYNIKIKYRTLHQIVRYNLKAKLKRPRQSHKKKRS